MRQQNKVDIPINCRGGGDQENDQHNMGGTAVFCGQASPNCLIHIQCMSSYFWNTRLLAKDERADQYIEMATDWDTLLDGHCIKTANMDKM